MPPIATEIATLPLQPGVDLDTPGSEGHNVVLGMIAALTKVNGYMGMHYGRQVESPDNFVLGIDWTEIQRHQEFEQSEEFLPFVKQIGTIVSGKPQMWHAEFREPFATAAAAPVVEMLTMYFPSDVDQANVEATLATFMKSVVDNAKGFVDYTTGWVVEDLEHENVEGKAKGYAAAIGWESIEAHMAYRDTQTFKNDIVKVRAIAKGVAMHHVKWTKA